jgi:nicotinamidase-related amidase
MIPQFRNDTALLLVDVQKGVDDLKHWGGPSGRRNNPQAENRILTVLKAWRDRSLQVIFTTHDSLEADSPLKLSAPGGALKEGFVPQPRDLVIRKDVNSAFVGTPLELELRRRNITRLVVAGFFTNMCISTTVRMANNLGFDTYLVHDACACSNRAGVDGVDWDPAVVHDVTVASLHGEFCTGLKHSDVLSLLKQDAKELARVQGNE